MIIGPLPIRLFCDQANLSAVANLNIGSGGSGGSAYFVRGDAIQFDCAFGNNGQILTALTEIASVTLSLFKAQNDTGNALMTKTVASGAMNANLTETQWINNTGTGNAQQPPYVSGTNYQHASFVFASAETAIDLGVSAKQNFWLRITALTTDAPAKTITFLEGPITVWDGPITAVTPPVSPGYKTVVENGIPKLALLAPDGTYHVIELVSVGGVLTVSPGDTSY